MSVVVKFGGTSVANADALRTVVDVVTDRYRDTGEVVCVVSATAGTTNELLRIARQVTSPDVVVYDAIRPLAERHLEIATTLLAGGYEGAVQAGNEIQHIVDELVRYCCGMQILEECTAESLDAVVSVGERLTSLLLSHALRATGIRAKEVSATELIKTDSTFMSANVHMPKTREAMRQTLLPILSENVVVVTQGFTGADEKGRVTTLGRGGSDASAAIIGACINAERIEIWTDVSGVYSAEPRLVEAARPIPSLSFSEIRELALYGAKVLHPDTIVPAVTSGIPVIIKNTFRKADEGTYITSDVVAHGTVHAVSMVRSCSLVTGSAGDVESVVRSGIAGARFLLSGRSSEHAFAVVHTPDTASTTSVAAAVAGTTINATPADVLICTGPHVNKTETLATIVTSVSHLRTHVVASGISPWSVFVVAHPADSVEALESIHRLCL